MSRQLLLALIVQALLMTSTTLLLVRSFSARAEAQGAARVHSLTRASGFVMLFLTFCWSVVFGIVLGLHRLPLMP